MWEKKDDGQRGQPGERLWEEKGDRQREKAWGDFVGEERGPTEEHSLGRDIGGGRGRPESDDDVCMRTTDKAIHPSASLSILHKRVYVETDGQPCTTLQVPPGPG